MSDSRITIRRGAIYVDCADYERYFAGLDSVVLLRDDGSLLILPVRHAAAGGFIVKRRNLAGDRVITAADFLRAHGLDDGVELSRLVVWSAERAGLIAADVFSQSGD